MRLSEWAKNNGFSYRGAYDLYKRGQLPNSYTLPSGSIMVDDDKPVTTEEYNVVYSRVSTPDKKDDLNKQQQRVEQFCQANGWVVHKSIKEIGSGLNDKRKLLTDILENHNPTKIIVEHKDRLTRFGFNYLKLLLKKQGTEIIVINETKEGEVDLMADFVSVITSMCARLYGLRRTKRKTEELIKSLSDDRNN